MSSQFIIDIVCFVWTFI